MIPVLGQRYKIEIETTSKPKAEYLTDAYFELDLPVAPAVMVGDEIVVEGADVDQHAIEAAICRQLGLPAAQPEAKRFLKKFFENNIRPPKAVAYRGGKMIIVEKFLGRRVEIPEDRRYALKQGLWGRRIEGRIDFGFSQPALVLSGGVKSLDWLVAPGQTVSAGETVVFAITGKILYIDSPVGGGIRFNDGLQADAAAIGEDPYGRGWLFSIQPPGDAAAALEGLATAQDFLASLKASEGFKNPEGIKGGVSGMCKAVYSGIGAQKV
jgi:glycine cleavage system H lipoate-binding protein